MVVVLNEHPSRALVTLTKRTSCVYLEAANCAFKEYSFIAYFLLQDISLEPRKPKIVFDIFHTDDGIKPWDRCYYICAAFWLKDGPSSSQPA